MHPLGLCLEFIRSQIESLFEIAFAAPPSSAFPDRSDFIGSSDKDEAGTATELAAFGMLCARDTCASWLG